jgi:hypothetical protein
VTSALACGAARSRGSPAGGTCPPTTGIGITLSGVLQGREISSSGLRRTQPGQTLGSSCRRARRLLPWPLWRLIAVGADAVNAPTGCSVRLLGPGALGPAVFAGPGRSLQVGSEMVPSPVFGQPTWPPVCGCSSMAELEPSKLVTRVRFPSPARPFRWSCAGVRYLLLYSPVPPACHSPSPSDEACSAELLDPMGGSFLGIYVE